MVGGGVWVMINNEGGSGESSSTPLPDNKSTPPICRGMICQLSSSPRVRDDGGRSRDRSETAETAREWREPDRNRRHPPSGSST